MKHITKLLIALSIVWTSITSAGWADVDNSAFTAHGEFVLIEQEHETFRTQFIFGSHGPTDNYIRLYSKYEPIIAEISQVHEEITIFMPRAHLLLEGGYSDLIAQGYEITLDPLLILTGIQTTGTSAHPFSGDRITIEHEYEIKGFNQQCVIKNETRDIELWLMISSKENQLPPFPITLNTKTISSDTITHQKV